MNNPREVLVNTREISVTQFAILAGVSRQRLHKYMKDNDIIPKKIGRQYALGRREIAMLPKRWRDAASGKQ